MADKTFDAVIVGGGNKALLLALYLHANIILPWYYAPIWRDFPDFWDYGARWEQHKCSDGFVFKDKENCLAIYSEKHDPTQERTAQEIARFSQKDADTWGRLWALSQSDEFLRVTTDTLFRPVEEHAAPDVASRQAAVFPKLVQAGFSPDSLTMKASTLRAALEWFESPELLSCILRFAVSSVVDINDAGSGMSVMGMAAVLPTIGFNRGGTHQIAHAAHQLLVQMGCEFFTNTEVDSAIVENGAATGIRLRDGGEIAARKLVVSTLSPHQLVFDLIGEEHVGDSLKRRVRLLEDSFGCLMWYSFAVHEAPRYRAEAFGGLRSHRRLSQPGRPQLRAAGQARGAERAARSASEHLQREGVVGNQEALCGRAADPVAGLRAEHDLGQRRRRRYQLPPRSRPHEEPRTERDDGGNRSAGPSGSRKPAYAGAGQSPDTDREALRDRRLVARRIQRGIHRVLQLLQGHRQGPGSRQAVGGAGKGGAGLVGGAATDRPAATAGAGGRGGRMTRHYDVIIIGSGPNALAIGAYLSRAGQRVLLLEKRFEAGGGLATEQVTLPDFYHNTHAIYKMMVDYAPVYRDFELERRYAIEHIQPDLQVAMPLADGRCLCIHRDVEQSCRSIAQFSAKDAESYRAMQHRFEEMMECILAPQTYVPMEGAVEMATLAEQTELGRELSVYAEKTPEETVSSSRTITSEP
jgi:phytoene dehydrogenase-like protein